MNNILNNRSFENNNNSNSNVMIGTGQNTAGVNQAVIDRNVSRSRVRVFNDQAPNTILQSSNIATFPDLSTLTYNADGYVVDADGNVVEYSFKDFRDKSPTIHVIQPGELPSNKLNTLVYELEGRYNIRKDCNGYTMNIVRSSESSIGLNILSRLFVRTLGGKLRAVRNNVTVTTTNSIIQNNIPQNLSTTQIVQNRDGTASFEILPNSSLSAIFTFPFRKRTIVYRCWLNISQGTTMNYMDNIETGYNNFNFFTNDIQLKGNAINGQLIFQRVGSFNNETADIVIPDTLYFDYSTYINGDTPAIKATYSSSSEDSINFEPDLDMQNWNQYTVAPGATFNSNPNDFVIFPMRGKNLAGFQANLPFSTVSWNSTNLRTSDVDVFDMDEPHIITNGRRNRCCTSSGVAVDRCLVVTYENMLM